MKRFVLIFLMPLLASCAPVALSSSAEVFQYFHTQSEALYDGAGSWGNSTFGYRMALRDSYWRADVYGWLAGRGGGNSTLYAQRADEAIAYLLTAQSNGGAGVFGFPAEPTHPEFGSKVSYMLTYHPDMITNGWIVNFPTNEVQQLYYDHGYALYSLARAYLRTTNASLLPGIIEGADWILDKPLTSNLNYLSALAKGLCLAYSITNKAEYLQKALDYHSGVIIPGIGSDGNALDSHNRQMEYHAFIVSGLIALRQQLTNGHPQLNSVNTTLELMVAKMAQRNLTESMDWEQTWFGTCLQAWHELEEYRPLSSTEQAARQQCVDNIRANLPEYRNLSDYPHRKSLYANFFIAYDL